MAIIKSYSPFLNLSNYQTFIVDTNPNSDFFRITEFKETFTGGKNGFLIEGSDFLKETTEVKIEILDVDGNPIYFEPGNGTPEYYEGLSTLISVHVYPDTPIGIGKITILGELKEYIDKNGTRLPVPEDWRGVYNVKWEKTFKVNRNVPNEDSVRFYRRPLVSISELVKPIFSKIIPSITQSGSLEGIALQPAVNSNLTNWTAGTLYKLKITDGSSWTGSVDDNTISIPSLGYSPIVKEVLNNKEVLVDIPYSINNIVQNFSSTPYTTSFEWTEGQTVSDSALTGSFAKIDISNLKTFVGDVARVKVFRKSRNEVTDYQFVQESKLESTELLRDITVTNDTQISYGNFTDTNLSTYWITSSDAHPVSINVDVLQSSVKIDYNTTLGGSQQLITSESFAISKDVEYTLEFKTLLSGSINGSEYIKAYLSSSDYQQTFLTVSGSDIYKTRQTLTQNIIASPISSSNAKLVFEISGDDWYISNVSLKNAQETSFSPDEFVLIQDIPRKINTETFDFKFEFYDINNNYIPVDVLASATFDGGNDYPTSTKILTLQSDRNAFRFITGSHANPHFQQIGFTTTRQNIVDNITYGRSVYDITGSYISEADYLALGGVEYPGAPHDSSNNGFIVQIDEFSGSLDTETSNLFRVGFITYTASADGLEEYETIYRLEDGDNAPGIFVSSTANQFIYKATTLSINPSGQSIIFDVKRKNLGTLNPNITINSESEVGTAASLTFVNTDPTTGVSTYTLAGSSFDYLSGSATYHFTSSDDYGIEYTDSIKITPVKILDGLSVTLTNENATLPAKSTGFVESGSFVLTSGSVSVKVGGEDIIRQEGLTTNNRWDIISATETNVVANDTTPDDATYGITRLDADSGSLALVVRYKDGAGDTTDVTKVVTYSKAKRPAPVVVAILSNDAQSVTKSNTGTYATPSTFTIVVNEGGSNYSYSSGGGINTYYVSAITSGSNSSGTITPTTPTTDAGTTVSLTITYVNSERTTGTISKTHRVSVTLDGNNGTNGTNGNDGAPGADGPGVVFRGPWSSTTTYYDTDDYPTRRDAVLYSGTYYATKTNAITNLNKQPDTETTFWESLGTGSYFVAAEIALFRESYVQNTLNIGTNNSGSISSANITLNGGTTYPYISIGQSATVGNQTYGANGIWIGNDGGTYKSSFVNGTNSWMKWDGSTLDIKGNISSTVGTIGGWVLGSTTLTGGDATLDSSGNITLGTSNNVIRLSATDSTYRLWIGDSTASNAPFRITKSGVLTASGASITGALVATSLTLQPGVTVANTQITGLGTLSTLNSVNATYIDDNSITTGKVVANTLDASHISALDFTGKNAIFTTGQIGGWTINPDKLSSPPDGSGYSRLTFSPSPLIAVNDTSGNPKLTIRAGDLTNLGAGNSVTINFGSYNINSWSDAIYQGSSTLNGTAFSFSATAAGTYSGTISMSATGTIATTPGSWNGYLYVGVRWEVASDAGFSNIIGNGTIGSNSIGTAGSVSISASSNSISFSIPTAGTYYARLCWNRTLYSNTTNTTTFYSTNSGVSNTSLGSSVEATELTDKGFQVVNATDTYLRIDRSSYSGAYVKVGGSISATGNITAYASSDKRLKENIIPIENALDKIDKISGVEFDWTDEYMEKEVGDDSDANLLIKKHDVGVIAQQIEEVLPEVVVKRNDGYLAVRYEKIVPLLIESIKELKKELNELKNK